MLAVDRALIYLESTTGFGRALEEIVVRRGGWPNRWLTAKHINAELGARGFWSGARQKVHPDARVRLLTRYLDHLVDRPGQAIDASWAGGSAIRPSIREESLMPAGALGGSSLTGSRGAGSGSTGPGMSSLAGRTPPFADGGWKRFDGQYKHNPRTKLIDYRAPSLNRSFENRMFDRVVVKGVTCQYGSVIDMSPTGIRFLSQRAVDIEVDHRGYLKIACGDIKLRVRVRVRTVSQTPQGKEVSGDFRRLVKDDEKAILKILMAAGVKND